MRRDAFVKTSWVPIVGCCFLSVLEAMNTHDLCSMARAGIDDGIQSKDLSAFAACGAGGAHPGNEFRDWRRLQERLFGKGVLEDSPLLSDGVRAPSLSPGS